MMELYARLVDVEAPLDGFNDSMVILDVELRPSFDEPDGRAEAFCFVDR